MGWLTDFFNAHIIEIYFIYGLGFFVLGMAVALESGHASALPLARATPYLAGFGLVHAMAEWGDMMGEIFEGTHRAPAPPELWALGTTIELVSFLLLLRFGCELYALQHPQDKRVNLAIPTVLTIYVAGLSIIAQGTPLTSPLGIDVADVWTTYCAGIPAFVMTIWGLIGESRAFRAQGWKEMSGELNGAAVAFCWYAVFDSLFVTKVPFPPAWYINSRFLMDVLGVPVQLFLAANALAIAFFVIRALRVFAAEDQRRLHDAIETQRRLQTNAAALNRDLREAAKEMSDLYDQLRQRDEVHSHLLNRVVRAQEEERRRVARDLHDGVGQTLSGLAAGLAALESRLQQQDAPLQKQMENMKTYAMQSVEELHRVITDLRPSLLDDLGLVAALRWYARRYTETLPLAVSVEVNGPTRRFAPEVEIVLFRIAQEALSNVVRHARANRANIRLATTGEGVVLEIEDDGIGFDPEAAFAAGGEARPWGLLGMKERAALVGGSVAILSRKWEGARVRVEIPLPAHRMEEASNARATG